MDTEFIKVFEPFSIIITTLNYKFKTNYKLSENDIENIRLLKIMIPIFNRIKNDKTVTLEQILNDDHQINTNVLPSAPTIRLPIDSDSDEYMFINNNSKNKSEEELETETSEDLEGDAQVETLTNESLNLLKFIRDNNWVQIDPVSDVEIEIEDDTEEGDDGEEDDEVVEKIPLSFNEDQEAPLLVSAN